MGRCRTELYLHLVWATWDRLPLIAPELEEPIYRCVRERVHKLGCHTIAIGGIEDHVHLLLSYPPTTTISDIVKHAKGGTSHLVTHALAPGRFFKWQGSYGAFTVAKTGVPRVRDYVLRQEEHHRLGSLSQLLELTG